MKSKAKADKVLFRAGPLRAIRSAFAARPSSADRQGSSAPAAAATPTVASASQGRKPISRGALSLALLGLTAALLLVLAASPVRAALTHPFESDFDASDSPDGSISADKVGIDQSTGNVYVIDKANNVLDKFDSSGNYLSQINFGSWGSDPDIAVDNSPTATQGRVAAAAEFGPVRVFDSSGTEIIGNGTQFPIPASGNDTPDGDFDDDCGLAIDPTDGDIYVAEFGQQAIDRFDSAGNFIEQLPVGFGVCDIAVDTDGTIYAVQWNQSLHKIDSSGTDLGVIDNQVSGGPGAVNIDPSNHHVYFDRGNSFAEYDAGAQNLLTISGTAELASGSRGIDVNGTTGKVYASNGTRVAIFGVGVVVPTVTTGSATNLTASAATLNGTVNPDGVQVTDCHFEYGTTTAYGQTAPCVETPAQIGAGSSDVPVHADITGLTSETTYHFRLVAANANGTNRGQDQTFTTLGALGANTLAATNITKTSATLNGEVNPLGAEVTDCHFEYGPTTAYGQTAPCVPDAASIPADSSFHPVSADITGLTPGTLYHFRLVATTANGTKQANDLTFTTVQPLLVTTAAATNVGQTTATVNGSVNPLGETVTDCHFEYGTDTNYGQTAPCAETVGGGNSAVPVHADISGLTPGTVYHFRLVATNASGTRMGNDLTFRTTTPPTISVIDAPCQGVDSALLVAQVKAGFEAGATFHFDYGLTDSYGTSTPDQIIDPAGGNVDKTIFAEISGLDPDTTYHFRGVAQNSIGQVTTADQTFSTIAPGDPDPCALPNNRAYERVSPEDKNGTDVERGSGAAALTGNAASFDSFGVAFGDDATGSGLISTYVGTRGSSGWSTEMVSPPIPSPGVLSSALPHDFSPNLDVFVGTAGIVLFGFPPIQVRDSSGSFTEVSGGSPLAPGSPGPTYAGGSSDFSHVVFQTPDVIPGTGAAGTNNKVYEYRFSDGMVHLVSILPGETPSTSENTIGSGPPAPNAVSDDGSRIFWSGGGNLYVRKAGTETVQVDASQGPGLGGGGEFWTASPADGSQALFTANASAGLTDDTVAASGANLYRYDVDTGELTNLTPDQPDARVVGVLGASADTDRVYFAARGVLDSGANPGDINLYVRDGSTTSFVTSLQTSPPDCSTFGDGLTSDACNWSRDQGLKTSRVTPDGETLLFTTKQPQPGGYDNAGFAQVYRFDLQDGLSCLSCNPSGAPATGDVRLTVPSFASQLGLPGLFALPERRNLSVDGDRAFFMSPEPLVNQDINDATDVYEWEQDGSLHLISTGREPEGEQFSNASASGDDVFFFTRKQLVSADGDDNVDLYDARVDGGFPEEPVEPCVGDACKPPPLGAPSLPGAGSSTTTGPGNQGKDTTAAVKKAKKKCKKIKNKEKRKKCLKKVKQQRRAQ